MVINLPSCSQSPVKIVSKLIFIALIISITTIFASCTEINLYNPSVTKSISTSWERPVQSFMKLFSVCKVQIISGALNETDELLSLAHYFGGELNTAVLIYTYLDTEEDRKKENGYNPSSFREDEAEGWRYTWCFMQLFTSEFLTASSSLGETTLLPRFGDLISTMSENPNYIVMLLNGHDFENDGTAYDSILPSRHISILQIAIASAYLTVRNGRYVDMICLPCIQKSRIAGEENWRAFERIDEARNLADVDTKWHDVNANFQQGYVLWRMPRASQHCSPYYDRLNVPSSDCSIRTIERMANFTAIGQGEYQIISAYNRRRLVPLADLRSNSYTSPAMFAMLRRHDNLYGWEWSTYGGEAHKVMILAVLNAHTMNLSAFWRSLDAPTWACVLLAASVVSATLLATFLRKKLGVYDFEALLQVISLTLGFLIDHSRIPSRKQYPKVHIPAALLLFLWTQVAMMISSGYRGALYSLLTSTPVPTIPQTMQELAAYPGLVVTTAQFSSGRTLHSLLHSTVDEFTDETNETNNLGVKIVRKNAQKFGSKLVWLKAKLFDVSYSQTEGGSRRKILDGRRNQTIDVPSSHIFVDAELLTSMYGLAMNSMDRKTVVVKGPDIPLMVQYVPVLVSRNFFALQFKRWMYYIVESGIWGRWEHYMNVAWYVRYYLHNYESLVKKGKNETGEVYKPTKNNVMAALFVNSESALRAENRKKFVQVPTSVLRSILILYSFMIFIALITLIVEYVRSRSHNASLVLHFLP